MNTSDRFYLNAVGFSALLSIGIIMSGLFFGEVWAIALGILQLVSTLVTFAPARDIVDRNREVRIAQLTEVRKPREDRLTPETKKAA